MKLFVGLLISFLLCCIQANAWSQAVPQLILDAAPTDDEQKAAEQVDDKPLPSISEKTKKLTQHAGFFTFYWDQRQGKIYLQVDNSSLEFLYVHSLATGLGSNPVGLDRGQLGSQKVVRFQRVGPKVLLIQRNLRFRAVTSSEPERRAVEQSFAESTIWGGKVVAHSDQAYLIDVTSLLLSDAHGVISKLAETKQGEFSLDEKRSAVYLPRCKAFPDNTELEATLTFAGKKPGTHVRQTTPTPNAVTLRQHHSFVRLPDAGYQPRQYDVRCPSMFVTFADFASPLDSQLEQRWIVRHRLIKKDPQAELSEAVEPIVYYVDPGAPPQIQQALMDGASWWNEAFQAAGFQNAFQVKLLPPDVDPLDVRYNVIQWVHRSTRGWSYGGSVLDPRTGEIIKGHVTLGSLRVRQDQLLVNGLQSAQVPNANCACCGIAGISEEATLADLGSGDALAVALARIRQLAAHEVGHTLGFVHNFAASTYGDRASVMDYPAPRVKITDDGKLDLSDAYGVGIGSWDKVAVKFAYQQFPENESQQLNGILEDAAARHMIFVTDADSRPAGAAHPLSNLWDNGTDPLAQLAHVMNVRKIAIANFDRITYPARTTTADIAQYFTPIYLHHRYQLKAVGKLIGGQVYQYSYAGDNGPPNLMVHPKIQRQAIKALMDTMRPQQLVIDPKIQKIVSPRPYTSIRDREMLPARSGRVFDPLAAARVAVDLSLNELLQPQRLARLSLHARTDGAFSPQDLVQRIIMETWGEMFRGDRSVEIIQISQIVREAVTERLISLADSPVVSLEVRAAALSGLYQIRQYANDLADPAEQSFRLLQQRQLRLFLERPFAKFPEAQPIPIPPGDPIGNR